MKLPAGVPKKDEYSADISQITPEIPIMHNAKKIPYGTRLVCIEDDQLQKMDTHNQSIDTKLAKAAQAAQAAEFFPQKTPTRDRQRTNHPRYT